MFSLNDMPPGDAMNVGVKDVHESLGEEAGSVHILIDVGVEAHGPKLVQPFTPWRLPRLLHFVHGYYHCRRGGTECW